MHLIVISYYKLAVSTMCSDPSKSVPMAMDILLGIIDIVGLSWGLYILIQFDGTMIIRLYIMFPEILFCRTRLGWMEASYFHSPSWRGTLSNAYDAPTDVLMQS